MKIDHYLIWRNRFLGEVWRFRLKNSHDALLKASLRFSYWAPIYLLSIEKNQTLTHGYLFVSRSIKYT